MRFKEIRLYPTEFTLDIYITEDASLLTEIFENRYGADEDFILTLDTDICLSFETDIGSELRGHKAFVIILKKLEPYIVVHELIHLMWQLNETINIEMNKDSQEWQALFMEYLTNEILKDDYDEKG